MARDDDNPIGRIAGKALDLLDIPGSGLLRDHKTHDPVVPADLHLVKPAKVDGDGNVTCLYCKAPTPWAKAELIGAEGYACFPCSNAKVVAAPAARSRGTWIVGAIVVGAAAGGAALWIGLAGGSGSQDDEEPVISPPPGLADLTELTGEMPALDDVLSARATESVRAERPWIVIEAPGQAPIRIDSRVFDRIEGKEDEENGPHLLVAAGEHEVALHVAGGVDEARRLAAALHPPVVKGKRPRLPAGPRLTVGDDTLAREGDHVRIGRSRFLYEGLCRRAEAAENLGLAGHEVQAALVWIVLRSESRRPLCDWEE